MIRRARASVAALAGFATWAALSRVAAAGVQPAPLPTPLAGPSDVPASPAPGATPAAFVPQYRGPVPSALGPATPQPRWTLRPGAVRPGDGGAAWSAPRAQALGRDLAALLGGPTLRGAHFGFIALDARDGTVLYERGADEALQAASTFKLLVGSAALDKLGPAYRFHTAAYLIPSRGAFAAAPVENGAVAATLVLRGGGDPFLSTSDLDEFAAAVARAGVRYVLGGFVTNVSHFDRAPYPAGWTWDDFLEDYAPKISALTLDENVVHAFVESGGHADAPAIVHAPPLAPVAPVPEATARGLCDAFPESLVDGFPKTLAPGATETLDVARGADGCVELIGGIAADSNGSSLDVAVPDPQRYAYRVALQRLAAHGVATALTGAPLHFGSAEYDDVADPRKTPGAQPIWSHDSLPLAEIMPRFWIPSDNLVGENLLEELGVAVAGEAGDRETERQARGVVVPGEAPARESAMRFERRWLRGFGVDASRMSIADGCGMSQYDRISPRVLGQILEHDWNGGRRDVVLDSLPVGGARGSIPGIEGTSAAGRVWAKTGSMMHVRGLAGYVATHDRGTVTFAFVVDDFNGDYDELNALRAKLLERIASE